MSAEVPLGPQEGHLTPRDLEGLTPDQLVDIIVWQQYGLEALNSRMSEIKGMVDKLAVDPSTGILTMGALGILADVLTEGKILEIMRERGYTVDMCFLDVDELKKHNSFGGHEGGNEVLAEVARRLKRLYRRKSDVVVRGLMQMVDEARTVTDEDSEGFEAQGRFARGDEMLALRFIPPHDRRRGSNLEKETERIAKGFEGAMVEYEAIYGLTPDIIQWLDPDGRFHVDENGIVHAPVTVTFVHAHAPMPASRLEMREIVRRADTRLLNAKHQRHGRSPEHSVGIGMIVEESDI